MTIFLSDLHLAAKKSKSFAILEFLRTHKDSALILVGDCVDVWRFRQSFSFSKDIANEHIGCIRKILKRKNIVYVWGNHDEFFSQFAGTFGNLHICEKYDYTCSLGKKYLVIHGHQFDLYNRHPWLCKLGDVGYDISIALNEKINRLRKRFGLRYWSLSKYIKLRVKNVGGLIERYENTLTSYAKKHGYDGVICGHIHDPRDVHINGIRYLNCGCWTDEENLTYLIDEGNGIELRKFDVTYLS